MKQEARCQMHKYADYVARTSWEAKRSHPGCLTPRRYGTNGDEMKIN